MLSGVLCPPAPPAAELRRSASCGLAMEEAADAIHQAAAGRDLAALGAGLAKLERRFGFTKEAMQNMAASAHARNRSKL